MFALRRATFLAARSCPRPINSYAQSCPSFLRFGAQRYQRYFSLSPIQVRYVNSRGYLRLRPWIFFLSSCYIVYYFSHREQVPGTGRWRFMDIDLRYEEYLRRITYLLLQEDYGDHILSLHHPTTRHIRRVVSDLLEASDLGSLSSDHGGSFPNVDFAALFRNSSTPDKPREWELLVIDDPQVVNAMVCFGTIVVFTGILPICRDDAGLTAVISHEIGHDVARHGAERISFMKIVLALTLFLNSVGLNLLVARGIVDLLFSLPRSRKQELEADTLGLRIAAKACYDPRSAVRMHTRLANAGENNIFDLKFEFLRTHPLPGHRIKHLEELVPQADDIRAATPRCAGIRESINQLFADRTRWEGLE